MAVLTELIIDNFKCFKHARIGLDQRVVFVGPNNSGKTSAMQALALWVTGLQRWHEKRTGPSTGKNIKGVTVNRKDVLAVPNPSANLLWHGLRTRASNPGGTIRINIKVKGTSNGKKWACGLEFDYANEESFYCRPLRLDHGRPPKRMEIPAAALHEQVAFLPPMSGLAANETLLDQGAVNVRIGEGRTAEVLRNLCYRICQQSPKQWQELVGRIKELFGCTLGEPRRLPTRGEIAMSYKEGGTALDLSSSGRGLQQTLLILAYMCANRSAVIMLDEPGAHLEILRQRQIYNLIASMAAANGNQIIAASHSEAILNESGGKDQVIAFVGDPHPLLQSKKSELRKSLVQIGYDQYYLARQAGWVLYLEGSTDLDILCAFADRLGNKPAIEALRQPFVRYVANQASRAQNHYHGLKEAFRQLKGIAIFDRLENKPSQRGLRIQCWKRREIENYLCSRGTLIAFAKAGESSDAAPVLREEESDKRAQLMASVLDEIQQAANKLGNKSPWSKDAKASDMLAKIFKAYFSKLKLYNFMKKSNFVRLVKHVPDNELAREINDKLDAITKVANSAKPG